MNDSKNDKQKLLQRLRNWLNSRWNHNMFVKNDNNVSALSFFFFLEWTYTEIKSLKCDKSYY